jgi:hypothetical protein
LAEAEVVHQVVEAVVQEVLEQVLEPQDKHLPQTQDLQVAVAVEAVAAKAAEDLADNLQMEAVVLLHFILNNLNKGIFYEK